PYRRYMVLVLFVAGMAVLGARAVELQVFQHDFLSKKGISSHTRVVDIAAHRGEILDRQGQPLAISTPVDSVWVNPKKIELTPRALAGLSRLLGVSASGIEKKVEANRAKGFIYLKRQLTPEVAMAVRKLGVEGVGIQREYRRYYPMGEVFGHVVGFTGIDDEGLDGIELAYNDWLRGELGKKRVVREGRGGVIENVELIKSARPGKSITLSIDGRLQYLAYRELKRAVEANKAESGSVVVMDPKTGEVLAMVNQPAFNPNNVRQRTVRLTRNRAVADIFEPGSTAKPFTIAAALDSGLYKPGSTIDTTPGYYRVSGYQIKDSHNLGKIDLSTIISKSSNVGASKVALGLESAELYDVFQKVGFGRSTGCGLPGEANGVLRNYAQWYKLDQATLSFGYGFSVTALQLAEAYAVLAADGVYHPVSLIKGELDENPEQVISTKTARAVRSMMERVVQPQGTGYRAAIEGYRVAGKTGTARKIVNGVYSEESYTAVFAGMAPARDPQLVTVVVIHSPRAGKVYGGEVAAPVFSRIMTGALRALNIPPDDALKNPRQLLKGEPV
ncbi:MAG TPA: penicillin-binding protein 2, partial [Gammaproteobacteria bacterium]|nr:penicillin-binding protein 2 [Gammaproteobacteria bacterium]